MDMAPQRILVVGTGMYVTGRGTDTKGTILPALLEGRRRRTVGDIAVCSTAADSAAFAVRTAAELGPAMHVSGEVDGYPGLGADASAYLDAMDRFRPDAVIIATPDATHEAIALAALERGIHCLVVKPLAPTTAACRRLIEAADRAGVVAQVEFHKRLDESNLLLRSAIRSGEIGRPLYAVVQYSQRKIVPEHYFRGWLGQTNILNYLGVHYIDLLHFATGYTPRTVTAWGQKVYLTAHGLNAYDAIQAVVVWDTGVPGAPPFVSTLHVSWVDANNSSAMSQQSIAVTGSKGRIEAEQTKRGLLLTSDAGGVREVNPYFTAARESEDGFLQFTGYGIESVLRFVADVAAARAGAMTPDQLEQRRPSFRQAFLSTAVIEAAQASLQDNSNPKDVTAWL